MTIRIERTLRREGSEPERKRGDEDGPSKPGVDQPKAPNELLKRMRQIDPDKARKYRQRSGQ
ncbi:MAG: ubiquitin-like protein UBact [Armatimonadetes bacterium]|nr:ubiquitin-like protein UBact [Armatimonadota bacterium]